MFREVRGHFRGGNRPDLKKLRTLCWQELDLLASGGLVLSHSCNGGMCVVSQLSQIAGRWWPEAQRKFQTQRSLPGIQVDKSCRTALMGEWYLNGHPMDRGFMVLRFPTDLRIILPAERIG